MANVPLDEEEDGVEIDDPELLAELDAAMEDVDRGEFGRNLDEILAEFRTK